MYSMGKHLVGRNILTVQIKGNIIFIYSHVHLPETRCKQDEHRRNMDPVDFKTFVHSSSHDTDKKTRVARRVLYITHINKSKHLL